MKKVVIAFISNIFFVLLPIGQIWYIEQLDLYGLAVWEAVGVVAVYLVFMAAGLIVPAVMLPTLLIGYIYKRKHKDCTKDVYGKIGKVWGILVLTLAVGNIFFTIWRAISG